MKSPTLPGRTGKDSGKDSQGKDSGDGSSSTQVPIGEVRVKVPRPFWKRIPGGDSGRWGSLWKTGVNKVPQRKGKGRVRVQRSEGDSKNGEMTAAQA